MELTLKKIGIINNSTIKLNGLTVICGNNNSGKSTAGKALYASIESMSDLQNKLHNELLKNFRRALITVSRILDLHRITEYVSFAEIQNQYDKDISMLLDPIRRKMTYSEYLSPVQSFVQLKDIVDFLSKDILLEFVNKDIKTTKLSLSAFFDNYEENRKKALNFLNSFDKYYFYEDLHEFAEKSVASLFVKEFNGQIYPANLVSTERRSYISISKNGEKGCSFSISESKEVTVSIDETKLFLNNAIYVEDPYALDKIINDDVHFYNSNDLNYSHANKLERLLLESNTDSLIEQSINKDIYDGIVSKINKILPGVLTVKETGVFYEETGKEPLRVQNLATGSKMFSIIKTLIEKGNINFDTMLILDEPEAHLHPAWQNILAEIIVLLVKELDTHVLLTTHSPNFLMALEAYSKKYELFEKTNYYIAKHLDDQYMIDYICVNGRISDIYSSFALPLVEVKKLKDE